MLFDFNKRSIIIFVFTCLVYPISNAQDIIIKNTGDTITNVDTSNTTQSQSKIAFGIAADVWIPLGGFATYQGMGFGVEGLLIFPGKNPNINFIIGTNIDYKLGKTHTETSSGPGWSQSITTTSRDDILASIIAGLKFGKEKGVYFLPAISMSYYAGVCLGFDFGGGLLLPLSSSSTKLNFGAKYSLLNLIGAEGESPIQGIRVFAGIVF